MFGITNPGVFLAGTIAIVLLPGPNSLYVLAVSSRHGIRMGYSGALGIFLGDALLMLLTAAGAASILQAHPLLFDIVRWSGAAYLAFLGCKLLRAALRNLRGHRTTSSAHSSLTPVEETSFTGVMRKALIISLLNPKAIFFYLSFFVQFVDPRYAHTGLTFLVQGIIVESTSMLYLAVLATASVRLTHALAGNRRIAAILNMTVGLLFLGFSLRLAG